jgi:ferredoxin-NADP reductase
MAARGRLVASYVYTRAGPAGWHSAPGRVTRDALAATTWPVDRRPRIYVCGPTPFVETVADWLTELGHEPRAIRTERFGGG